MKTVYRHFYIFYYDRAEYYYVDIPLMESSGFWLTAEMEYTRGSTCKFWIPPGQLRYIEKIPPHLMPETEEA